MARRGPTGCSLLVGNPTAHSGKAGKAIKAAMNGLERARLRPEFFPTLPEGATVAALSQRLETGDIARVIYLGGDGTFAETAKGIILARERYGVDVPLGMLPMGTANDQGRSFGVQAGIKALDANIQIIVEGVEQWLDVGRVEALDETGQPIAQDLWFDSWGVGLSAQILAKRNRDRQIVAKMPLLRQIYRDRLVYVRAGISSYFRSLLRRRKCAAEIIIDGQRLEYQGVTDIVITGTILYGGDWIFAPEGKPDDGMFEVVIMKSHADWAGATLVSHKRLPVTDDELAVLGVRRNKCPAGKNIEVRLFRPAGISQLHSQIDGEEFTYADHYRVENLFHHLRIIVPEDPHWV
ncbi:MAG: diacylglycerol/lipid kinase family protein [Nannocystaceae bacterium]